LNGNEIQRGCSQKLFVCSLFVLYEIAFHEQKTTFYEKHDKDLFVDDKIKNKRRENVYEKDYKETKKSKCYNCKYTAGSITCSQYCRRHVL